MDTAKTTIDPTHKASEAAQEQKPEQPPVRYGFAEGRPGTLCLELDLDRIPRAWARGTLLDIDGVVSRWYLEQAKIKAENANKIKLPGFIANHSAYKKLFKA